MNLIDIDTIESALTELRRSRSSELLRTLRRMHADDDIIVAELQRLLSIANTDNNHRVDLAAALKREIEDADEE